MATTLLRTLTLKSQLKFGIDYDKTVDNLLSFKKNEQLAWYYFNSSMISFTDEVLNLIGIGKEFRIEKPGKNNEKGKEWKMSFRLTLSNEDKAYISRTNINSQKGKARRARIAVGISSHKNVLQAKNHGQ